MSNRKVLIPFAPANSSELSDYLTGASVVFFCGKEIDSSAVKDNLEKYCADCIDGGTADSSFEEISAMVISCIEKYGNFNTLIFAPVFQPQEELLLDLNSDDFAAHTDALNALFNIAKCFIPYMLGQESPEILLFADKLSDNLISNMYNKALKSFADSISSEFTYCGISIKFID